MMEKYIFWSEKEDEDKRIDVFLAENLEELSRSAIKKICDEGGILVRGKAIKTSYRVRPGDFIVITVPEPAKLDVEPEDIPLDIVYEDMDVLVVNKPKGMVVHPAAGHYSGTLVNALLFHAKGELSGINGVLRPGIVHRIDKDTSGLLAVAKNDLAHVSLSKQLSTHSVTRKYYAVCHNCPKEEEITIDKPIGRNPKDRKKMSVTKTGKRAVTHIKVLERFRGAAFVEAQLETGRTHQIRVHMANIGYPIMGDLVYGPKNTDKSLNGQALHAGVLGFTHPRSGEYMEFSSPLPEYFERLLRGLRGK